MYNIINVIEHDGPKLSRELIDLIVEHDNVSEETARKRLSRLKAPIYKLKGLFSDNQSFYYHEKNYRKPEFYDALIEALKSSGKKYFSIIKSIEYHYGFINKDRLAAFSYSPVKNLKGHRNFDSVIGQLIELGIIYEEESNYKLNSSVYIAENYQHSKSLEVVENFLIDQFNDWSRSIGLTSYNLAQYYSEFSKFLWAYVSPSYITSLVRYNEKKMMPGFVVADILIGNKNNDEAVIFFLKKIEVLKNFNNISMFLPFLITDYLDHSTFKMLKEKGIIIGLVDKMFGDGYKELINSLINSITNAGAILKNNPNEYLKLIDSINKLATGKTNNLKGDLFELAVGYYHGQKCKVLDIGKIIYLKDQQREVDVLAVYDDKIIIAECKGYKNKIDKDEIEKWVSKKVSVIRQWILSIDCYAHKKVVFEHWSTGGYTDKALDYINSLNVKKYKLEFIDFKRILEKSKEIESKKFKQILKDYYMTEL